MSKATSPLLLPGFFTIVIVLFFTHHAYSSIVIKPFSEEFSSISIHKCSTLLYKKDNRFKSLLVSTGGVFPNRPINEEHEMPNNVHIKKEVFYPLASTIILALIALAIITYYVVSKNKLERQLYLSLKNYESLFRENNSICLLIDMPTGNIHDANTAAIKFYGYSIEEFKKLNLRDITLQPEIEIKTRMEEILKDKKDYYILKHRKKNGVIKNVEVYNGLVNINDKTYIYSIIHDITERLNAQNEIIEAKQRAEESDRLKSAFLANMSHEIRTPMNSILGFAELLSEGYIEEKEQKSFIKLIYTNGEYLLKLINDIIDISKIEANQLRVQKRSYPLNILLNEVYLEFENKRKTNELKFDFSLQKGNDEKDFLIYTDPVRLKQILLNLLNNAFKFTDQGSVSFGYKMRDDGVIQFFVKDTGIGIPEKKHKTIFMVFQQVEDSLTRNYSGTGLGLSITKSLVEILGGHIWVMSEPEKGSRFYFTHPAFDKRLNL